MGALYGLGRSVSPRDRWVIYVIGIEHRRFDGSALWSSRCEQISFPTIIVLNFIPSQLCASAFMISDTRRGYSLFQKCTPLALQLMGKFSNLWSPNSTIVLAYALHASVFEISWFVFSDTLAALALGIPPLLHYDTTYYPDQSHGDSYLELVYGCPARITVLLAQINSWRASRWMEQPNLDANQWREAEELLQSWSPPLESEGESYDLVGRFAIGESWRHAVFIYLYMVSRHVYRPFVLANESLGHVRCKLCRSARTNISSTGRSTGKYCRAREQT